MAPMPTITHEHLHKKKSSTAVAAEKVHLLVSVATLGHDHTTVIDQKVHIMGRWTIAAIPAAMLIFALVPLPYGYYTLLRLVVTGCALVLAWFDYQETQGVSIFGAVLIGIGVLFNPIVAVHLSREIWMPIDIGAAAFFTFIGIRLYSRNS